MFGWVAAKTQFCAMGSVADVVNFGDWTRMRQWLLAMAIAILGAAALQLAGWIDVSRSVYAAPNLLWLSNLVGGLLFGVGMTLASGCGSRSLVRAGSGNLKSLVVLMVLAIAAYMTLRGLFGVLRVQALDPVALRLPVPQDLPSLAAAAIPGGRKLMLGVISLAVSGALLAFVFRSREFATRDNLLAGTVVGLAVVAGWVVSGHLGYLAEDPETLEERFVATNSGRMESLSFVAPVAYLLELAMFWSDKARGVSFGIAAVLGVFAGSLAWSLWSRSFRLESFRDAPDLLAHLAGGALMGFGGVVALGCTIGQGVSGVSTLALGSILSLLAIVAGAAATMKAQYWWIGRAQ